MTVPLFWLQSILCQKDGLRQIRPYGIGYLAPIMLHDRPQRAAGGLRTVFLSCLAAAFFLSQPYFSLRVASARSGVEILMLLIVGLFAVSAIHSSREKALMLADISGTEEAARVVEQMQRAAESVPGVQGLRDCAVWRRGLDLYVEADIVVDDQLSHHVVREITHAAEQAISRSNPLIYRIRVRAC